MKKQSQNHTHKYKKINLGKNGKKYFVYKCVLPICSHYVPIDQAEGKLCICHRCHQMMLITRATLVGSNGTPLAEPHCAECTKRKKSNELDAVQEFLNKTGI